MIVLERIRAGYGKKIVVEAHGKIDGKFIGVVGPNGSGKTTLLKVIAGILKPISGKVIVEGLDVFKASKKEVAATVTLVSQDFTPVYDFKVIDLVKMAFSSSSIFPDPREDEESFRALKIVGMSEFAERYFSTLSGGEKRLVMLARALAQDSKVILVDELELHLDPNHKKKIAEVLKDISRSGKTVVAVFHDIQLATTFSEKFIIVNRGRANMVENLNERDLEEVFGISFKRIDKTIMPWY